MAGFGFPREMYAEFYLHGAWHNLIGDVRQQQPMFLIERGRKSGLASPAPSVCRFTLDNLSGDYSPRNPVSPWFPDFRRNAPFRMGLEVGGDAFARPDQAGWGDSPDNGAWTEVADASGGTSSAVVSGVGQHILTASNRVIFSELHDVLARNVEVAFTWSMPALANVTGGTLIPGQAVLRHDGSTWIGLRIEISTAEVITLRWITNSGTVLGEVVTLADVYSGQTFRVRAQADGSTFRGKVWETSDPEPLEWHIERVSTDFARAGYVAIRSGTGLANTNVPVTVAYDDVQLRVPRMAGESSSLKPGMNAARTDKWVDVECSTLFRRKAQGKKPVLSPMRRAITASPEVFAYWPCEDGRFATELAPGLPHKAMRFLRKGDVKLGSDDTFPASEPLPSLGTTEWREVIPPHAVTGTYQFRSALLMPGGQDASTVFLYEIMTTGTAWRWHVQLETDGSLSVRAFAGDNIIIVDDFGNPLISDTPFYLELLLTQDGANINYSLSSLELGATALTTLASGTAAGRTIGTVIRLGVIAGMTASGTVFPGPRGAVVGHLSLANGRLELNDAAVYFNGHVGETVTERAARLASEAGMPPVGESDDESTSARMGPQQPDTLMALLNEGADTDQGFLYEARGTNAFAYKPLDALYRPVASLTLDQDAGHLSPDFAPSDDDLPVLNDVTAKARRGGEATSVVESGPNNANDPGTAPGAVGRADGSIDVNPFTQQQLIDIAGWATRIGTADEPRFPGIHIDLRSQAFTVSPELSAAVLDTDIGDAIELDGLTRWDIYEPVLQYVIGYTEALSERRHNITFPTTPAGPYRVGSLDDGEIRLDSDTSTLAEDVDDTETAIDVTTAGSTRWVTTATHPAEFPFDIAVGGERMTVTGIVGAGATQTFTVTRSVNGVIKSHDTGDSVSLAAPYYLGL